MPRRKSIFKNLAAIATVAAFLAASLGITSPASAAIAATITVSATDVTGAPAYAGANPSGATTVDFAVKAVDDYSYVYYNYVVAVTAPDGAETARWSGQYEIASGQWRWTDTLRAGYESFWDAYGTYTVTATVNFYGAAGNVPIDTKTATDTFTFSGPDVAPPPPPAPVQIDGEVFSIRYSSYLRRFSAIVQSEYQTPASGQASLPVRWQLLVGRKVVRERSQSWSETDTLGYRLPRANRTKYIRVKLKENGVVVFKRSYKVKGRNA